MGLANPNHNPNPNRPYHPDEVSCWTRGGSSRRRVSMWTQTLRRVSWPSHTLTLTHIILTPYCTPTLPLTSPALSPSTFYTCHPHPHMRSHAPQASWPLGTNGTTWWRRRCPRRSALGKITSQPLPLTTSQLMTRRRCYAYRRRPREPRLLTRVLTRSSRGGMRLAMPMAFRRWPKRGRRESGVVWSGAHLVS